MFDSYMMQMMSWWALFGVALAGGLALSGNDDDDTSSTPTEPPVDPELVPFEVYGDFNAEFYADIVTGTPGDDEIIADLDVSIAINGMEGNDVIEASYQNDYILGGFGDDDIKARVGDDVVRGEEGNDTIQAGYGDDSVSGGAGNDEINAFYGNDIVSGGDGNDYISGHTEADTLFGDAGNDTLSGHHAGDAASAINKGNLVDKLDGGEGDDELWLSHGDEGTGGAGKDLFLADWRTAETLNSITITDYNASDDQISVLVKPPAEGEPMPEITQQVSEDGADRLIYLNGAEIARVVGAGAGEDLSIQTLTEPPASANKSPDVDEEEAPAA